MSPKNGSDTFKLNPYQERAIQACIKPSTENSPKESNFPPYYSTIQERNSSFRQHCKEFPELGKIIPLLEFSKGTYRKEFDRMLDLTAGFLDALTTQNFKHWGRTLSYNWNTFVFFHPSNPLDFYQILEQIAIQLRQSHPLPNEFIGVEYIRNCRPITARLLRNILVENPGEVVTTYSFVKHCVFEDAVNDALTYPSHSGEHVGTEPFKFQINVCKQILALTEIAPVYTSDLQDDSLVEFSYPKLVQDIRGLSDMIRCSICETLSSKEKKSNRVNLDEIHANFLSRIRQYYVSEGASKKNSGIHSQLVLYRNACIFAASIHVATFPTGKKLSPICREIRNCLNNTMGINSKTITHYLPILFDHLYSLKLADKGDLELVFKDWSQIQSIIDKHPFS